MSSKYQPADGEIREAPRKLAKIVKTTTTPRVGVTPSPPVSAPKFTFRCQLPMDELTDAFKDLTLKPRQKTPELPDDGGTFVFKSDMFKFVVGSETYSIPADTLVKRSEYFDKMINGPWKDSVSRTMTLNETDFDVFDAFFNFLQTGWYDKKFVQRLALPDENQRINHKAYSILLPDPSPFNFNHSPPPQSWPNSLAKPPVDPESYSISFHLDLLVLADYCQVDSLKWSATYYLAVEFRELVRKSCLHFKHARARIFAEHVFEHPYPYVVREAIATVAALNHYWRPSGLAEFDRTRDAVYDSLQQRYGLEIFHISSLGDTGIMNYIDRRYMGRFWREILKEPDEEWL